MIISCIAFAIKAFFYWNMYLCFPCCKSLFCLGYDIPEANRDQNEVILIDDELISIGVSLKP